MQVGDLGCALEMQQSQYWPVLPMGIVAVQPYGTEYTMAPEVCRASYEQPAWVSLRLHLHITATVQGYLLGGATACACGHGSARSWAS